jgi:hypothetical protein
MPQATEALTKKWGGAQGIGEDKAMGYLQSRGFVLTKGWEWKKPRKNYQLTDDEVEAICFLIQEWDFGGIENEQ